MLEAILKVPTTDLGAGQDCVFYSYLTPPLLGFPVALRRKLFIGASDHFVSLMISPLCLWLLFYVSFLCGKIHGLKLPKRPQASWCDLVFFLAELWEAPVGVGSSLPSLIMITQERQVRVGFTLRTLHLQPFWSLKPFDYSSQFSLSSLMGGWEISGCSIVLCMGLSSASWTFQRGHLTSSVGKRMRCNYAFKASMWMQVSPSRLFSFQWMDNLRTLTFWWNCLSVLSLLSHEEKEW